jgi:hypothetical protein
MGYPINSTWTRLREKDINRLNEIIDDEYCIEQEIGRKLHIMEVFENLLEEEFNRLKWSNIKNFMNANNWEWSFYENGKSFYKIPDIGDMRKMIRREFFNHALYDIIELGKKEYTCSTGGFVFNMGMTGEYPSKENCYLNIWFDIAHFVE